MRDREPLIEYPCRWSFRIIGTSDEVVRAAISAVVGELAHEIALSNVSSTAKYVSLQLHLVVEDDAERLELYRRLAASDGIKAVL